MSSHPGSLYRVGARRYVDSQPLYTPAGAHDVVPLPSAWRVLAPGGSVRCAMVEGRPALPGQRGALYELAAEGGVNGPTTPTSVAAVRVMEMPHEIVWPRSTRHVGSN